MRQSRDPSPWCSPSSGAGRHFTSALLGCAQIRVSVFSFLHPAKCNLISREGPETTTPITLAPKAALVPAPPAGIRHHEEPALGRRCPRLDALGKRFILSAKARVTDLRVLLEQLSRASE